MKNVGEGDVEDRVPQGRARDGNRLLFYNFFCDAGLLRVYIARRVNGIARGLREKPVVQSGVRRLGLKVAATFTGIPVRAFIPQLFQSLKIILSTEL